MSRTKTFAVGAIFGSMLVGGVSYAADHLQIDVTMPSLSYWLDGSEIPSHNGHYMNGDQEVPLTITYKGTNYAPVRFLTDAMDKEISFDKSANRIDLQSAQAIPFQTIDVDQAPQEIQRWVERSKEIRLGQVRTYDNDIYVLATRGEENTGGYGVQIEKVMQYSKDYKVSVKLLDPPKGSIVIQPLTYPYALVKLQEKPEGAPSFEDQDGRDLPQPVGFEYVPEIIDSSDNISLFQPRKQGQQFSLQGMVRAFEGVLHYTVINADGGEGQTGMVQASAGAPDWGFFHLDLPSDSVHPGMSVRFHLLSPKDGSQQEEVVYTFSK